MSRLILPLILAATTAFTACKKSDESGGASAAPVPVQVAHPLPSSYQETTSFTGRLAAVESVDLRAQVSGYLSSVDFKAGATVEKGQTLFTIDPRPYQAEVDRAQAALTQAEAALNLAELEADRAQGLLDRNAVARQEVDQRDADVLGAQAEKQSAQAALSAAELNLEFTTIKAPVAGRISAESITAGNLVQPGSQAVPLALLTSIDVIYVYFDVPEATILSMPEMLAEQNDRPLVDVRFDDGTHSWEAQVDYVANEVDPATGTLRVRGVIQDASGLVPGMFCRVEVRSGEAQSVQLIAEQAILSDQGNPFVYVVDDGEVTFRPIRTGELVEGRRAVLEGLGPDDQVIVSGVMRLRPGMPASAEDVEMPSLMSLEGSEPKSEEDASESKG